MNKTIKVCAVLLGILVPVIIFISGIEAAVFDKAFYMDQMEKNQVTENTGIYPPDMELVVDEIISYLKGDRQDFDIKARLNAVGRIKQATHTRNRSIQLFNGCFIGKIKCNALKCIKSIWFP